MQEQINPGDTKQVDRPLTKAGHRETYNTSAGGVTIACRRSVRPGREVLGEAIPLLRSQAFGDDESHIIVPFMRAEPLDFINHRRQHFL